MNWIISIHIIAIISWFAGLFYLPRLFVYHANTTEKLIMDQFKIMEKRLYYFIMTPAMIVTLTSGFMLMGAYLSANPQHYIWLNIKLFLVFLLLFYHIICGYFLAVFQHNQNTMSHKFFRIFNEIPTVLLIFIVILAVVKPF